MAATGPATRLPPEWNYSVTRDGRIFFVNEQLRQTTWLHPLTGHSVQTGYERVKGLPMGWEYGYTPDGDLYFVNHNDQRTTFEHPVTGTVSNKKLTFRDYGYPAPETPDDKNSKQSKPTRSKSLQVPAAKRSPDAKITRKGWLYRYESTGMGKKTWKKRWCVLAEYALFFYKDEKEKHSLGSILLPSYRINNCDSSDIVNKAFAFKIEHENTKTCYLAADNIDELNVWLRSVQEAAMLKGSPSFQREHNNNFTNFSKLNNMKLIPKSPIIVQHDDSDDEVPFFTKLSEWEKSWKSPGTYRKGNDDDLSPPETGGNGHRYPNMDHPLPQGSNLRSNNRGSGQFPYNDLRNPQNEDPSKGYSGSDDDSPCPGNLQRWHNEPLRESNRNMEIDPRYSSMVSDRSDVRQQRLSEQYRHNESQGPYMSHNNDVRGSTRSNVSGLGNRPDPDRSRDQLQRMSYDGTYSPKRAEDERNMPNKRDFPGRFIDSAYHPSLQNLPGPVQKPIKDDRIFPEFQDRTQSQPNLARSLDDQHRFQKPIYSNHTSEAPIPKTRGSVYPEQHRPPIAAPRVSRNTQQGDANFQQRGDYPGNEGHHQNLDRRTSYSGSAYDRGSFAKSSPINPRDSSLGLNDHQFRNSGPRDSYSGVPNGQRNSLAGQRNSFHGSVGQGGPRDSYSGSAGQRNSFHGSQRGSYVGEKMPQENFQRDRNRESYASNRQRDSYSGNRNSQNFQDPGALPPSDHEMTKHPVAAPRSSLSPNRNPGLTIDIPPNYINLPPGSHPPKQQQDEGPHRPPYPAAMRHDVIKELAQNKTPRTSQQYLTSAENEMKRMQQSPYFQYPSNQTLQNTGSKNSLTRPADSNIKDSRWEDNSARELRAAYERVQQLQHQKPNDPNIRISAGLLVHGNNTTLSSATTGTQRISHISLSNPSSSLLDPSLSPLPLQGSAMLYERDSPKYAVPSLDTPPPITRITYPCDNENQHIINQSKGFSFQPQLNLGDYQTYGTSGEPSPIYEIPETNKLISPIYHNPTSPVDLNQKNSNVTCIYQKATAVPHYTNTSNGKLDMKEELFTSTLNKDKIRHPFFEPKQNEKIPRTSTKIHLGKPSQTCSKTEQIILQEIADLMKQAERGEIYNEALNTFPSEKPVNQTQKMLKDNSEFSKAMIHFYQPNDRFFYLQQSTSRTENPKKVLSEEIYGTVNKKKPLPRKTNLMHTVKEDPNMSDKDILMTTEIKNLNKKYPLNGTRVRMSISANDLIGKNHDELVLLLIQLRRNQAALEKARDFYKIHLETRRVTEKEYKKQRQNSPGYLDRVMEEEHKNYTDLRHQMDEIENKLEVYRPIINLVDNMVTMGSLYGGDNLMLATQYRKHLLHPDEYIEPKDMINFSRQRQENKMVEEIENEIKQLTDEEVDLEEKLERLYELDRRLQEQSFLVTSFSDDKEMMERTLQGILNQQNKKRDDPREMKILIDQQRTIERELSRVTQQLAEASRLLEETTAENNKVDHEVALLRTKVHGDLQRSRSAPSLVGDNEKTKRKMENELAKVQNMMSGLSKEGERLQQAMKTIRRSSSGAQLASLLDDEDNKPQKKSSGYMQTDLDTMESIDISKRPRSASSMPDINTIQPETNIPAFTSNYATMSSPLRSSLNEQMDYVDMQDGRSPPSSYSADLRSKSKSLNELSNPNAPQPPPRDSSRHPLISHQRQQSSVAPPSEMYNRLGEGEDMWDISDAGDNTKRFYGLIPREKTKALTVRDVKRQSEQRREREKTRRGTDDLTDDESRWSLAEGNEPININHMRYPSDSTGSMLSNYMPESTQNGMSQPLYENLPRATSVPNMTEGPNVPRRSSSIGLLAPKPFTPYHKRTPSSQSSESSQAMQEVELPGFMQKKVSTLSASKPFYSEMDIQTYNKPGTGLYNGSSDNISGKTYNNGKSALPWLKSGSQLMGNVLNVNKNPRGRYTTISSSEPVKREQIPFSADAVHNSSAGDLASNKSIDEVPDVVKSSTSQVNKIDEQSIDDILRGPQKVLIPERYIPDSDDEDNLSNEEVQKRLEKAKKIKKILAQQSVHSLSQPDVSRLGAHEKAKQEKAIRTELLDVRQELAIQAKRKSKKDAAERRKTWSGGQIADIMAQIPSVNTPPRMVQDLETSQLQQQQRHNILV